MFHEFNKKQTLIAPVRWRELGDGLDFHFVPRGWPIVSTFGQKGTSGVKPQVL